MRRSRFTKQQIVAALRQAESGTPVVEVWRKLGFTEQTFYRWKRKFAGMRVAELRRLREGEEENRRLKQLVADLTLDKQMLQEACEKLLQPAQKRAVVQFFRVGYQVSERRACRVAGVPRSSCRYRSQARDQAPLHQRLRELAAVRVQYGYRRLHVLLRREGWRVISASTGFIERRACRFASSTGRKGSVCPEWSQHEHSEHGRAGVSIS